MSLNIYFLPAILCSLNDTKIEEPMIIHINAFCDKFKNIVSSMIVVDGQKMSKKEKYMKL